MPENIQCTGQNAGAVTRGSAESWRLITHTWVFCRTSIDEPPSPCLRALAQKKKRVAHSGTAHILRRVCEWVSHHARRVSNCRLYPEGSRTQEIMSDQERRSAHPSPESWISRFC